MNCDLAGGRSIPYWKAGRCGRVRVVDQILRPRCRLNTADLFAGAPSIPYPYLSRNGDQSSRAAASSAGRSILIIPIMACMALG